MCTATCTVYLQTLFTEIVIVLTTVNVSVRVTSVNCHDHHDHYPDLSFYGIKNNYTLDRIHLYLLNFRNSLSQLLKFTELLYGHID
jgi:hypothetical protein